VRKRILIPLQTATATPTTAGAHPYTPTTAGGHPASYTSTTAGGHPASYTPTLLSPPSRRAVVLARGGTGSRGPGLLVRRNLLNSRSPPFSSSVLPGRESAWGRFFLITGE